MRVTPKLRTLCKICILIFENITVNAKKARFEDVEKLAGCLEWISRCTPIAKGFTSSFHASLAIAKNIFRLSGNKRYHHRRKKYSHPLYVDSTEHIKIDLEWWRTCLILGRDQTAFLGASIKIIGSVD